MQRNDVEKLLARLIDPSNISLHLVLRRRTQPYLRELLDAINDMVIDVAQSDFNYLYICWQQNIWSDCDLLTVEIFLKEENISKFLDLPFLQYVDDLIKGPYPNFKGYDFSNGRIPLQKEIQRFKKAVITADIKNDISFWELHLTMSIFITEQRCEYIIFYIKEGNKDGTVNVASVEVDCWAKNIRINGVYRVEYRNESSVTACIKQVLDGHVDEQTGHHLMHVSP